MSEIIVVTNDAGDLLAEEVRQRLSDLPVTVYTLMQMEPVRRKRRPRGADWKDKVNG